jgi:hypothetical protein
MGVLGLVVMLQMNYNPNQNFQEYQPIETDTVTVIKPNSIPTHTPAANQNRKEEPPITREEFEQEIDNLQPQY